MTLSEQPCRRLLADVSMHDTSASFFLQSNVKFVSSNLLFQNNIHSNMPTESILVEK